MVPQFVSVSDYEEKAKTLLKSSVRGFYESGAGDEQTLRLNKSAFQKLRIRPRVLRDVSHVDLTTSVFQKLAGLPFGIAPTGMQKVAHPDGESGNARAIGTYNGIYIQSTVATTSIEELAANAPSTRKWFQLYPFTNDLKFSMNLIRRSEIAGFEAIVITVDVPVLGLRRTNARDKFILPSNLELANLRVDDERAEMNGLVELATTMNAAFNWDDVEEIVAFTKLPVIIKGILTKEDALIAKRCGCKGVIVSNHGGRQLDSTPASIEALPEIVSAVGDDLVVMMDGGICQGTDVFKALALGAQYVFIGRSSLWGLVVNGQEGVEDVIRIIKEELEATMALSGCTSISNIYKTMVVHENYYSKL